MKMCINTCCLDQNLVLTLLDSHLIGNTFIKTRQTGFQKMKKITVYHNHNLYIIITVSIYYSAFETISHPT